MISRALISVSDKTGIAEFAKALHDLGIEILSTGGTASLLTKVEIPVMEVSTYTGFPEIMGGRVKTLHPKIHGGLLGRRGTDDAVMTEHGIKGIDLVVVNLYPFQSTIAKPECVIDDAVEMIDIGGPTMLRAAAKNHKWVTVVVDPDDYPMVLDELTAQGDSSVARRRALALKAFEHTATYDSAIARYLGTHYGEDAAFPDSCFIVCKKRQDLRYGENPHQSAAFYVEERPESGGISRATQLQGKELSFNNIADTDAALECVWSFSGPACVIVKHANPCGVAVAETVLQAYEQAYATDPTSAFGGIIAFNRPLDAETARAIIDRQFVEVIAAPSIEPGAREVLATKSQMRVMETDTKPENLTPALDYKRVNSGLLIQDRDLGMVGPDDLRIVSKRSPTDSELQDLLFAWRVVKTVKSNAIVYAKEQHTIGIGAGQMSRVYSARLAAIKAGDEGLEVEGSVMASDAFFPFRDGIDSAAQVGITAVIQPGGSMRDEEIITAANDHDIAMVFTGMRHFKH